MQVELNASPRTKVIVPRWPVGDVPKLAVRKRRIEDLERDHSDHHGAGDRQIWVAIGQWCKQAAPNLPAGNHEPNRAIKNIAEKTNHNFLLILEPIPVAQVNSSSMSRVS